MVPSHGSVAKERTVLEVRFDFEKIRVARADPVAGKIAIVGDPRCCGSTGAGKNPSMARRAGSCASSPCRDVRTKGDQSLGKGGISAHWLACRFIWRLSASQPATQEGLTRISVGFSPVKTASKCFRKLVSLMRIVDAPITPLSNLRLVEPFPTLVQLTVRSRGCNYGSLCPT